MRFKPSGILPGILHEGLADQRGREQHSKQREWHMRLQEAQVINKAQRRVTGKCLGQTFVSRFQKLDFSLET